MAFEMNGGEFPAASSRSLALFCDSFEVHKRFFVTYVY